MIREIDIDVERAELKKIIKSLNDLKTKEIIERYHQEREKHRLKFEELRRIHDYFFTQMAPSRRMVSDFRDRIKSKLIELRKIKNKGEDVSDLINHANDLMISLRG